MTAHSNLQLRSVLGPAKFNYWYEALIDLLIANPEMLQSERARRLGRTQAWVSMIENSDSFKERYALRRANHSSRVSQLVEDKLHNVTNLALDKLKDALETKDIKPEFALDATDTLLQRLGYTGKSEKAAAPQPSGPMIIQVVNPVSPSVLKEAQTAIRANEEGHVNAAAQAQVRPEAPRPASVIDYSAEEIAALPPTSEDPPQNDPSFRGDGASEPGASEIPTS